MNRILLVDDNAKNLSLVEDILRFHGYEILAASSGRDGVELAKRHLPDLIMMDIQMAGMDGITACALLKGDPATREIKIIALTSFAMDGDREKFLAAGFHGYLSKPIDTRGLADHVKRWLEGDFS